MLRALILLPVGLGVLVACQAGRVERISAAQDFQELCAGCHGATGKGDGPLAEMITKKPADLTRIAARNGGTFDKTKVMSVIDGFFRHEHGNEGPMPEFGDMLEGQTILYDDGSGQPVPVPARLLNLANYLESLQGS